MKPLGNKNINKNYVCCIKLRQEVVLDSYQILKAHYYKKNSRKKDGVDFTRK